MFLNTKVFMDKITDDLKNNSEISGYVKHVVQGDLGYSQKQFPFIMVDEYSFEEIQLLSSSGILKYTFVIYVGEKSLAAGVAYQGDNQNKKGIVELCDDIKKVILNNDFNGLFLYGIDNISIVPRFMVKKDDSICIGKISFTGEIWFKHS